MASPHKDWELSGRVYCLSSIAFSAVSLPSFSLALLWVFFTTASFWLSSSVVAHPQLSRTSSYIRLTPGHLPRHCYPHKQQFSPITTYPPSVRIPSRVTGHQAMSPKQSPPHLTVSRQDISALDSRLSLGSLPLCQPVGPYPLWRHSERWPSQNSVDRGLVSIAGQRRYSCIW